MAGEIKIGIGQITPQAGSEGRGSWVDKLQGLVGVIGSTQAANPAYSPFPAGTPTLATNQLIEQARSNAAGETLRQKEYQVSATKTSAPTIPTANTAKYAVRTAAIGTALDEWQTYLGGLGLGEGQNPGTSESEQWINKTLPTFKASIYDEVLKYGGSSEDAESVSLDIENLLRSRAGLPTKTADQGSGSQLTSDAYNKALAEIKARQ